MSSNASPKAYFTLLGLMVTLALLGPMVNFALLGPMVNFALFGLVGTNG